MSLVDALSYQMDLVQAKAYFCSVYSDERKSGTRRLSRKRFKVVNFRFPIMIYTLKTRHLAEDLVAKTIVMTQRDKSRRTIQMTNR